MAVIDSVGRGTQNEFASGLGIDDDLLKWFRSKTSVTMWNWYKEHRKDAIVNIGVLFLSYTVRVKHVRPLFVMLFGPKP
jgi:hypothetical protein